MKQNKHEWSFMLGFRIHAPKNQLWTLQVWQESSLKRALPGRVRSFTTWQLAALLPAAL
jgi:hypothetical protein